MLKYIYDDWNDPKVDKEYQELWDKEKDEIKIIRPAYQSKKQRESVIALIKNMLKKN